MNNIYDNGSKMLGQAKKIRDYNDSLYRKGTIDKDTWLELEEELVLYEEDSIIIINYDNSMGISIIDSFDERDILKVGE